MNRDRGSVTIWILGLCIGVLFLGGLSLDLWRAFTERRLLAGMADGATVAAATAIDETAFRDTGIVVLDPDAAADRARRYLVNHPDWGSDVDVAITSSSASVAVRLERDVGFTLLRVLLPSEDPLRVTVRSLATPATSP